MLKLFTTYRVVQQVVNAMDRILPVSWLIGTLPGASCRKSRADPTKLAGVLAKAVACSDP